MMPRSYDIFVAFRYTRHYSERSGNDVLTLTYPLDSQARINATQSKLRDKHSASTVVITNWIYLRGQPA